MPRRNAAVALLVPLALIGCGADTENGGDGPDATTAVRATVAKFGVATRAHDWQAICDDAAVRDARQQDRGRRPALRDRAREGASAT